MWVLDPRKRNFFYSKRDIYASLKIRRWICYAAALFLIAESNSQVGVADSFAELSTLENDTTYCWEFDVRDVGSSFSRDKRQRYSRKGTNASCPIAITFKDWNAITREGENRSFEWTLRVIDQRDRNMSLADGSSKQRLKKNVEFIVAVCNITVCALLDHQVSTCEHQHLLYNASQTINVSLVSNHSYDVTTPVIYLPFPGPYIASMQLELPALSSRKHLQLNRNQQFSILEADSDVETITQSRKPKGRSVLLAMVLTTVSVTTAAILGALFLRKKKMQHSKHSQQIRTPYGSGSAVRDATWTEVYATNEPLPPSILIDDRNALMIMRASRLSSPRASKPLDDDSSPWDVQVFSSSPPAYSLAQTGSHSTIFASWPKAEDDVSSDDSTDPSNKTTSYPRISD